jgi:hypothetical protein
MFESPHGCLMIELGIIPEFEDANNVIRHGRLTSATEAEAGGFEVTV